MTPTLRRLLHEGAVLANVAAAQGAFQQRYVGPSPHYASISGQWLWDAGYVAWAIARCGRDVPLAREILLSALTGQVTAGPDAGMLLHAPGVDGGQPALIVGTSQTPMVAWLAARLEEQAPDRAFAERVYPALCAHLAWWRSPRRDVDGDGLSEYAGPNARAALHESGLDVSPLRERLLHDPPAASADGLVHDLVADVGLNALLHAEARALAELARLVAPGDADQYVATAAQIATAMRQHMWDDRAGAFMPVLRADLDPERRRLNHVTPHVLLPLWAGVATTDEAARTVDLVRGTWRRWPEVEGCMTLDLAVPMEHPHAWHVTSDGLTPPPDRPWAVPCGSAARTAGGWRAEGEGPVLRVRWPRDRSAANAWFARLAVTVEADQPVQVRLTDSTGCTASATDLLEVGGVAGPPPPDAPLHGLRELEVHAPQGAVVRRVTVDYSRPAGQGLLARYGLRSNHPLDGKSPVTGAPTHYWSGTVWAPYAWHAAHALAGCGESELAQELARGYLDGVRRAFALGRVAPEHHCADTGTGMGADRQAWTAAVALLLAEELLGEEPLVAAPEHQVRGTP